MTQPAVPVPVQRSNDGGDGPAPQDREHGAGGSGLRRATAIAAVGVPVGLLWWVLAPSGLNALSGDPALRNGSNLETWLPRDLVLAGLFLLAGCIAGALASGTKHQEPSSRDVVLAVAAGAAGALLAWGTGVLCGLWWGTEDASTNASIAFSLRSYAVLAIWPAAIAVSIFAGRLFAAPRKPSSGEPAA
ncbi:hypothetical protein [Pseudarthrobacter sp. MM222]|uniref:hypothetical protein n=1 Tax=Pseudarthrobacter sp. MM222 TaxID=3018929 RepID=UPI00221F8E0D|nr:hypothetical protein [Pseudarthrobacter sp. MM222]CAI3796221.1 hypothetical protein NKCBBBOE_01514 [Pseudarthrobacter sp. MM222]